MTDDSTLDDVLDSPGYKVHRAMEMLAAIDRDQLDAADQERLSNALATLNRLSVLE